MLKRRGLKTFDLVEQMVVQPCRQCRERTGQFGEITHPGPAGVQRSAEGCFDLKGVPVQATIPGGFIALGVGVRGQIVGRFEADALDDFKAGGG